MLACASLFSALSVPAAEQIVFLVQHARLAGSQFHALAVVRDKLRVGDRLELIREPDNAHDPRAIRVDWQGHPLGYVPRRDNRALAAALDRGEPLHARISQLRDHPDPWQRLTFDVLLAD